MRVGVTLIIMILRKNWTRKKEKRNSVKIALNEIAFIIAKAESRSNSGSFPNHQALFALPWCLWFFRDPGSSKVFLCGGEAGVDPLQLIEAHLLVFLGSWLFLFPHLKKKGRGREVNGKGGDKVLKKFFIRGKL